MHLFQMGCLAFFPDWPSLCSLTRIFLFPSCPLTHLFRALRSPVFPSGRQVVFYTIYSLPFFLDRFFLSCPIVLLSPSLEDSRFSIGLIELSFFLFLPAGWLQKARSVLPPLLPFPPPSGKLTSSSPSKMAPLSSNKKWTFGEPPLRCFSFAFPIRCVFLPFYSLRTSVSSKAGKFLRRTEVTQTLIEGLARLSHNISFMKWTGPSNPRWGSIMLGVLFSLASMYHLYGQRFCFLSSRMGLFSRRSIFSLKAVSLPIFYFSPLSLTFFLPSPFWGWMLGPLLFFLSPCRLSLQYFSSPELSPEFLATPPSCLPFFL